VAELSGGNQQKVVVGRALVSQPSLLVVRRGAVVREFTSAPWDRQVLIATAEGFLEESAA
jgi:ABC-type sugar transport system ATPase subunit